MSQVKMLELRDSGTFIPILCVDMNPANCETHYVESDEQKLLLLKRADMERNAAQRYLLRRCGYPCDGRPNIIVTRLDGVGQATNDPYAWKSARTFPVAHRWIIDNWAELKDGDVVDVQYILRETASPRVSERVSVPSSLPD